MRLRLEFLYLGVGLLLPGSPLAAPTQSFSLSTKQFQPTINTPCTTEVAINGANREDLQVDGAISIVNGSYAIFCPGAKHTWKGTITFAGYTFASDTLNPLIFRVTDKDGYTYQSGKGTVKSADGLSIQLGEDEAKSTQNVQITAPTSTFSANYAPVSTHQTHINSPTEIAPLLQESQPGYHSHDGFYLHLNIGAGYSNSRIFNSYPNQNQAGMGVAVAYALGGTIYKNLIAFGKFSLNGISVNKMENYNNIYSGGEFNNLGLGAGLAYYFIPRNAFVTCSLSMMQLGLSQTADVSDTKQDVEVSSFGPSLILTAGQEWWVSANWALGVELLAGSSYAKNKFADNGISSTPLSNYWKTFWGGVGFSATYH